VITFGFDNSSLKISDYKFRQAKDLKQSGISFRLGYKGSFVPVILNGVISKANAYALSAAAAVGAALNLNLVEIAEAMSNFKPPPGRLNIISGIKNSWILDDTYNASPDSMNLALETLKEIQAKRKIVVLGDMLELGEYSEEAHLLIGQNVFQYADAFFAIGPKMKFAYDEAEKNHMEKDKICWFNTSQEACLMIQNYIQEGDVILIKGSRGMHMEQIVEEIKA
jgi:UDP-N-acetylmuramoyl-tripeptide--D-alanyl-D-alanine ligase